MPAKSIILVDYWFSKIHEYVKSNEYGTEGPIKQGGTVRETLTRKLNNSFSHFTAAAQHVVIVLTILANL
jgi:hypothetical protein